MPSRSPVRVAVLGFGYWGPNLARNVAEGRETRLAAVVDPDPGRRDAARARHPAVGVFPDAAPVLADPDVDAVAIATPIATHAPLVRAALRAGKHVLAEKPLAGSVAACEELADLAERAGRVLLVDHTFLFTPAVRRIREAAAEGALGQLLHFDSVRVNLGMYPEGTNVLWDLAPHDFSILDFVLGGERLPRWVSAVGARHGSEQVTLAYVHAEYEDGLVAHLHLDWLGPVKTRRLMFAGTKRALVYDATSAVEPLKIYECGADPRRLDRDAAHALRGQPRAGDVLAPRLPHREALAEVVDAFAGACLRGARTPGDAAAAVRVVRAVEAAQRSLERDGVRVAP